MVPVYELYLSLKKKIHVESHIVVPVFVLAWFSDLRQVQNLRPTRLFSSVLFVAARSVSFLLARVQRWGCRYLDPAARSRVWPVTDFLLEVFIS
jgi:hypothetical protein